MLAMSVFKLLILGVFSEIFQKNRLQKSWAVVVLVLAAAILVFTLTPEIMLKGKAFAYDWIDTKAIQVSLVLAPSLEVYKFGALLGMITLVIMFYNCFYDEGKIRLRNGGLYLLIFVAMMFLISAENMMQLLISVCFVDILCFYLLKDSSLKRRYMFYNVMADMILMIMFALVWGDRKSLDMAFLFKGTGTEVHRNLISWFWCFVVVVKAGLVLFHDFVLDLRKISLVRGLYIFYAATPMAGLLILWKMYAAAADERLLTVIQLFAAGSMLWAFVGALAVDDLRAKIMYWNMMTAGLMAGLLGCSKDVFLKFVPWLPWCGIMLSTVMILPIVAASNERYVSRMGGFVRQIKWSLLAVLLVLAAELQIFAVYTDGKSLLWVVAFLFLQLVSVSHVLGQIYFGPVQADEKVWALLKNPHLLYFLPPVAFVGLVFSRYQTFYWPVWAVMVVVLLFMILRPLRVLGRLYAVSAIQTAAPCAAVYNVLLVAPVKILGRVLWLTIDFVFIERTIIMALRRLASVMIKVVLLLHANMQNSGVFFTAAGAGVLALVYYLRGRL